MGLNLKDYLPSWLRSRCSGSRSSPSSSQPWTAKRVYDWCQVKFNASEMEIVARGNKEYAELVNAIANDTDEEDKVDEVADVLIFMYQLCGLYGVDPQEIVDKKMEINRRRSWVRTKTGGYQHVEMPPIHD